MRKGLRTRQFNVALCTYYGSTPFNHIDVNLSVIHLAVVIGIQLSMIIYRRSGDKQIPSTVWHRDRL